MSVTYTQAMKDIGARVKSVFSGTTVVYDNDKRDTPTDVTWVRANIVLGPTVRQASPGCYRTSGILVIQIFSPIGTGHTDVDTLVEATLIGFRSHVTTNGVTFRACEPQPVGRREATWQTNVNCNFDFDTIA